MSKYQEIDLSNVKTYSIKERHHKVQSKDFANINATDIEDIMPNILEAKALKEFVQRLILAYKENKQVILMMGGHVVKVGLTPIIIDLMKRGVIKSIAINGSTAIHDFEVAFHGATSEDVADTLKDGMFGMVQETSKFINETVQDAALNDLGLGESLGKKILEMDLPNKEQSFLAKAYEFNVPVTVHIAIGNDTIHQLPICNGSALGKCSLKDFRIFANEVGKLENGVIMNFGSAVILPEVFLKALTMARNVGKKVDIFTAANFDCIKHYRPTENIVKRPTMKGGWGHYFIGYHEILMPMIYQMFLKRI